MKNNKLELVVESALMRSSEPLTVQMLINLFEKDKPSKNQIEKVIDNSIINTRTDHSK